MLRDQGHPNGEQFFGGTQDREGRIHAAHTQGSGSSFVLLVFGSAVAQVCYASQQRLEGLCL